MDAHGILVFTLHHSQMLKPAARAPAGSSISGQREPALGDVVDGERRLLLTPPITSNKTSATDDGTAHPAMQ